MTEYINTLFKIYRSWELKHDRGGDFQQGPSFQPDDPTASSLSLLLNSTVFTLCESQWEDHLRTIQAQACQAGLQQNPSARGIQSLHCQGGTMVQLFRSSHTGVQVRSGTMDQHIKQGTQQKASHRTRESLRLEKTNQFIWSNHPPIINTTH